MTALDRFVRSILMAVLTLIGPFALAPRLNAQTHVVSSDQLKQQVRAVAKTREANLQKVDEFLVMPRVQKNLETLHISTEKATAAVATLNDADLAQLAARTEKAKSDFAAGTLSDRDLLFIIAGIAALILIIVAVR